MSKLEIWKRWRSHIWGWTQYVHWSLVLSLQADHRNAPDATATYILGCRSKASFLKSITQMCPKDVLFYACIKELSSSSLVCVSHSVVFDSLRPLELSMGFSVYGILQARILKWIAIPFSRGTSQPRNWNLVSCMAGRFFTVWATGKSSLLCSCYLRAIPDSYHQLLAHPMSWLAAVGKGVLHGQRRNFSVSPLLHFCTLLSSVLHYSSVEPDRLSSTVHDELSMVLGGQGQFFS